MLRFLSYLSSKKHLWNKPCLLFILVWRVNGVLLGGRWMKWWNLGGGNSNICWFSTLPGEMIPIWRAYFSDGLVQPPTRNLHHFFLSRPDTFASRTAALQVGWPLALGLVERIDGYFPWLHDLRTLTGWWFQMVFIFIPTWGDDPFWQIFLKWVETTN